MATRKKPAARRRKKPAARKKKRIINWPKIIVFVLLTAILTISLATAGYVIFFRTVFAQEVMPVKQGDIVYEEPDPPQIDAEHGADEQSKIHKLPKVAIIIDDMGYDERLGRAMLELPIDLTYSFLPFAPFTSKLEEEAFFSGKTIFLHLPLQPQSLVVDPGPGTLYVTDNAAEQLSKLRSCLREVPHAVGVNNHMGSKFTRDESGMGTVMKEMAAKKLVFIDSVTSSESVAYTTARHFGVKSARRHVFLDNNLDVTKICRQLDELVIFAEKYGRSIGIGHPHKETLDALSTCAQQYTDRVEYVGVKNLL